MASVVPAKLVEATPAAEASGAADTSSKEAADDGLDMGAGENVARLVPSSSRSESSNNTPLLQGQCGQEQVTTSN
eukprot:4197980-Amphidinium_carterae.1